MWERSAGSVAEKHAAQHLCHFLFLRLHTCNFLLPHLFLMRSSLSFCGGMLLRLSSGHLLLMAPLSFGSLLLLAGPAGIEFVHSLRPAAGRHPVSGRIKACGRPV